MSAARHAAALAHPGHAARRAGHLGGQHELLARMPGFFANQLPMMVSVAPKVSFAGRHGVHLGGVDEVDAALAASGRGSRGRVASSTCSPKVMVPRQMGVTCRSLWPSWIFCMGEMLPASRAHFACRAGWRHSAGLLRIQIEKNHGTRGRGDVLFRGLRWHVRGARLPFDFDLIVFERREIRNERAAARTDSQTNAIADASASCILRFDDGDGVAHLRRKGKAACIGHHCTGQASSNLRIGVAPAGASGHRRLRRAVGNIPCDLGRA